MNNFCKYTLITCDDPTKDKQFTLLQMAGLEKADFSYIHKTQVYSMEPDQYYFYIPRAAEDLTGLLADFCLSGLDMTRFDASNIKSIDSMLAHTAFRLKSLNDIKISNLKFKHLSNISRFLFPYVLKVDDLSENDTLDLFDLDLITIDYAEKFIDLSLSSVNKIRFNGEIYTNWEVLNRYVANCVKNHKMARLGHNHTTNMLIKPPCCN